MNGTEIGLLPDVAKFACADETSLASCSGTSPNGSPLDTSVAQVGGHTYTVTGVDKAGNSSSLTVRYTVQAGPITFNLKTGAAPNAHLGKAYSHRFVAIGTPTPKVSLAAGNLPPSLKLAANGTLSGKPTRVGTYKFTLTATNGAGTPAKIVVSVKVVKG